MIGYGENDESGNLVKKVLEENILIVGIWKFAHLYN